MRSIRRTVFAALASASLLGGVTGAVVATMTAAAPAVVVAAPVHVAHPTAVEYAATAIEY